MLNVTILQQPQRGDLVLLDEGFMYTPLVEHEGGDWFLISEALEDGRTRTTQVRVMRTVVSAPRDLSGSGSSIEVLQARR
jgi:hypothetical protein